MLWSTKMMKDLGWKMSHSPSFKGIEFEQIFYSRHQHLRAFEIVFFCLCYRATVRW